MSNDKPKLRGLAALAASGGVVAHLGGLGAGGDVLLWLLLLAAAGSALSLVLRLGDRIRAEAELHSRYVRVIAALDAARLEVDPARQAERYAVAVEGWTEVQVTETREVRHRFNWLYRRAEDAARLAAGHPAEYMTGRWLANLGL